ncbi:ABC transporter permease [Roseomonas marmotae]|uniref:ABC transporter permease n=1 Tax=Roseomonas marmotae TaxID=2768161 RepID=A0ABS3K6F3_9PROT|nr:ABC transporter permease [Roseomonas marmotae]MBO1073034.1 ABC transporter permease [Roseomonas marmotae]QTI79319.1 ABC transporter permease [Roseomonas marmotae]
MAPLLIFLLAVFVLPIGTFLLRAVQEADVPPVLPRTIAALSGWDGGGMPDDAAFAALVQDLREARARDQESGGGAIGRASARLNNDWPGFRSLLPATARRVATAQGDARQALLAASPEWGTPAPWAAIRRAGGPVSDFHLLAVLDLKRDAAGDIAAAPPDQAIFRAVLWRTLWISLSATVIALLIGYPLAWLIATAPPRWAPWLLGGVLLPFWTSLIVRTAAWMVLLQREGVVNAALQSLHLTEGPLPLLFNRGAVLLAMVHILLPFMVLPIYASLKALDWRLPRAALSLGASPARTFFRISLPLSLPGVGAGCLLVFIQALGFYVTPALLGGANDQMLSYFVGFYATRTVNWSMAAALSCLLLAAVAIVVGLYARLVGFEKTRAA